MVKGRCFTRLDGYDKVNWPISFVAVPRIGEWVLSICGSKELKVCRVTHYTCHHMPMVEVELTKVYPPVNTGPR